MGVICQRSNDEVSFKCVVFCVLVTVFSIAFRSERMNQVWLNEGDCSVIPTIGPRKPYPML